MVKGVAEVDVEEQEDFEGQVEDQDFDEADEVEEIEEDEQEEESDEQEGESEDTEQEESEDDDDEGKEESEEEGEEDEIVVSIGDEKPEEEKKAPKWVKDLRKSVREKDRKIKELEAKVNQSAAPKEPEKITLGNKPKLSDDGIDYDEDLFHAKTEEWFLKKAQFDAQERKQAELKQQQDLAWQKKLEAYDGGKKSLKVSDFEDAEEVALQSFNNVQQGLILQYAKNPALLVYALGKNKKRALELAKIDDHILFAIRANEIEKEVKAMPKKSIPSPERVINGTGKRTTFDSTLEKLRAKADKTGDYTQLLAYKRSKQN
jgi:hypothetical protein